ncbi:LytR/AlgR family response regulator transcription factor [Aequorivita xiaoshiensis]|uniref:Response regulator n=1 Tax=Aequorivita xiaoshiensis TaxID=2874476 RepID=A0A9X1R5E8_9FLAO|nr:response regulator [Aequorivita xiaoshiensis]MCG2431843.1 response regulator [Aequorivita xiaoshiensis]
MIRYILVDDDPKTLSYVKSKIDTIANNYALKHIKSYSSSINAFKEVDETDYDLLIVDFEMPGYNGLELAQNIGANKKVIFLTSTRNNEQNVINHLDISGYLSKPFAIEEFEIILKNKVVGRVNSKIGIQKGESLILSIGVNQDIGFNPDKIFYITTSKNIKGEKANKNCVHFFKENDEVISPNIRISINALSKKLEPYGFEKINQSTIINLSKINRRFNKELTLIDCNETFTIADHEKKGVTSKIKWLFGI